MIETLLDSPSAYMALHLIDALISRSNGSREKKTWRRFSRIVLLYTMYTGFQSKINYTKQGTKKCRMRKRKCTTAVQLLT